MLHSFAKACALSCVDRQADGQRDPFWETLR
jgi:hypothetical protein